MQIGSLLANRYEVLEPLPSSSQVDSARAVDRQTGQHVVLQRLLASPISPYYATELERWKRRSRIRIGHPNVVDPIATFDEDGTFYLVTPYVDGPDLVTWLYHQGSRLSADRAVAVMVQIVEALRAIHANGVVHRDIKPENMLVTADGRVHIIDFGIARLVNVSTVTRGSDPLGSPGWMAPEQVADPRSVDHRCDLYAAGAILHLMLTGQTMTPDQRGALPPNPPAPSQFEPTVPPHLDDICTKLLAYDRNDRFSSADELLHALPRQTGPVAPQGGCPHCSRPLVPNAAFCPHCGHATAAGNGTSFCLACGTQTDQLPACPGCQRTFSQSQHQIAFDQGDLAGRTFRMPEGDYVVGRDQLNPNNTFISRRHLRVLCLNGRVDVEDAGSTNKACINNQPVHQAVTLTAGHAVALGGSTGTYYSN